MSSFRTFRLDGNDFDNRDMEFYFKVEDDDGHVMGNFCVNGQGLFYYKQGSQVLTPNENENTLATYDGFLSFEKLKELFETLNLIGHTFDDEEEIVINQADGVITLTSQNN